MSETSDRKIQIRCLNCFSRFFPVYPDPVGACPKCSMEWRLTWAGVDGVKVRGPVWDKIVDFEETPAVSPPN